MSSCLSVLILSAKVDVFWSSGITGFGFQGAVCKVRGSIEGLGAQTAKPRLLETLQRLVWNGLRRH